jgi:hypothetical protein
MRRIIRESCASLCPAYPAYLMALFDVKYKAWLRFSVVRAYFHGLSDKAEIEMAVTLKPMGGGPVKLALRSAHSCANFPSHIK